MKDFTNKNVLITGGAAGIGKIMFRLFLERGAKVIIWDINPAKIGETVQELSLLGEIKGYQVSVADNENLKTAY